MASLDNYEAICAQIVGLEIALEETVAALEQKTNELEVLGIQASRMQSAIRNLEASRKTREHEIEAVRFDGAQEKSRLQEQFGRMKKENDGLRQELKALRGKMVTSVRTSDSCGQCGSFLAQLDGFKEQLAQQSQQLEADSGENSNLQQQIDYIQSTYGQEKLDMEADKLTTDTDNERLKKRLDDLKSEYENLQREIAVLRGQLLATEELANNLQASTSPADCSLCSDLQVQIEETMEQLTQRYEQLEAISSEKLQLKQKINKFLATPNATAMAIEAAIQVAERYGRQLRKQASELEKANEDLMEEIAVIRGQMEAMQEAGGTQEDALMAIAKLRTELVLANETIRAKEEEMRRLTEERDQSGMMNDDLQGQQRIRDIKRILFSATTGLIVGMLLEYFIK